jgi:hypothetical protein
MRRGNWTALLLATAAFGLGCSEPSLDLPGGHGGAPNLEFTPALDAQSVSLVFRARLHQAPSSGTPWLFEGELSDYYARALKRGEVPSALKARAVPLRFWRDATDCWMQPSQWLEPDTTYSLAVAGLGVLRVLRAQATDKPRATRLFPPLGARKYRLSVVCNTAALPAEPLTLEPGGVSLVATPGMAGLPEPSCVTLQVEGELSQAAASPPVVADALLDPSPWLPLPAENAPSLGACAVGEAFFGACLEVLDDRLRVTPLASDLLFALHEPRAAVSVARAGGRAALLRGLVPDTAVSISGSVLSSRGNQEQFETVVTTTAERRHLVLNEVLANPVGQEPDAEWIELVNDSERPASLADAWLEDAAGHVRLPDATLAPGELALLVNEGFRASGLDVSVASGVRLLRVPSLGARGLSNGGEALLLVGREGVLSRFPLLAAAHAGRSIARRGLDDADDDPAAFAEHGAPGASPGALNTFD